MSMNSILRGKRVLVTGGSGFLGSFVVEGLSTRGCAEVFVVRKASCDLTSAANAADLFATKKPQVVIHLAATVGGIGANQKNPALFFRENMLMGVSVIEQARRVGTVEKLVFVGTTCSYPKFTPVPFREKDFWSGYPEETNAPYGIAKKALLVMLQSYRAQFGLNGIYLIPANLYGPRDNFDLQTSHVIPAIIRKCEEAKRDSASEVILWGSGEVTREFFFVRDAAEAILLAAERYEEPEPVNIGSGEEILISELAEKIRHLVEFSGKIRWDHSYPDGQPRRRLDISRAVHAFGFRSTTTLERGLQETIAWYREQCSESRQLAVL